jgi:hypothetical protein
MHHRRAARALALVAVATALTCVAPPLAAAAAPRVLASHLDRPRGLAIGADGTLYAGLMGSGGRTCDEAGCFGSSAKVVRVARDTGRVTTVAAGLLSMRARSDSAFTVGPAQLAVLPDGRLATAIGAQFLSPTGRAPAGLRASLRKQAGHVITIARDGTKRIGVNASAAEFHHDPDGQGPASNPYGIAALGGRLYVTDAAGNSLLDVTAPTATSIATFPRHDTVTAAAPEALAAGPDGSLYVGEYTGGNQTAGLARIWRVLPGHAPKLYARGLTTISGLAFGPDGSLYATEWKPGIVVKIAPGGATRSAIAHHLPYPGGIAVAGDGSVYVSTWSIAGKTAAKAGRLKGRTGRIVRLP